MELAPPQTRARRHRDRGISIQSIIESPVRRTRGGHERKLFQSGSNLEGGDIVSSSSDYEDSGRDNDEDDDDDGEDFASLRISPRVNKKSMSFLVSLLTEMYEQEKMTIASSSSSPQDDSSSSSHASSFVGPSSTEDQYISSPASRHLKIPKDESIESQCSTEVLSSEADSCVCETQSQQGFNFGFNHPLSHPLPLLEEANQFDAMFSHDDHLGAPNDLAEIEFWIDNFQGRI